MALPEIDTEASSGLTARNSRRSPKRQQMFYCKWAPCSGATTGCSRKPTGPRVIEPVAEPARPRVRVGLPCAPWKSALRERAGPRCSRGTLDRGRAAPGHAEAALAQAPGDRGLAAARLVPPEPAPTRDLTVQTCHARPILPFAARSNTASPPARFPGDHARGTGCSWLRMSSCPRLHRATARTTAAPPRSPSAPERRGGPDRQAWSVGGGSDQRHAAVVGRWPSGCQPAGRG
jgi:hypothetical protein